jgi:hypothetical protein
MRLVVNNNLATLISIGSGPSMHFHSGSYITVHRMSDIIIELEPRKTRVPTDPPQNCALAVSQRLLTTSTISGFCLRRATVKGLRSADDPMNASRCYTHQKQANIGFRRKALQHIEKERLRRFYIPTSVYPLAWRAIIRDNVQHMFYVFA